MRVYNPIIVPYVVVVIDVGPIRERFSTVAPFFDERGRRLVAAAEAFAAGYGGIAAVAMATGMAPSTIGRGLKELAQDEPSQRVRRPRAGRKPVIVKSLPSRKRRESGGPGEPVQSLGPWIPAFSGMTNYYDIPRSIIGRPLRK